MQNLADCLPDDSILDRCAGSVEYPSFFDGPGPSRSDHGRPGTAPVSFAISNQISICSLDQIQLNAPLALR